MSPGSRTATLRDVVDGWEALFGAQVAVMRRLGLDPAFKRLGMKEYDVLYTLSRCPGEGLRLNELNDHVLLAQSSLSRLVERLEKKGLLSRCAAPDDGRGILIRLTEEGQALQKDVGRDHVREIGRLLGGALDDDEILELRRLSDKLRLHVQREHPL